MRLSCGFAHPLCLALLLASFGGELLHDRGERHGELVEAGYDCTIDHQLHGDSGARHATPSLCAAGELHRHRCVGCHLGGKRLLAARAETSLGAAIPTARNPFTLPLPARRNPATTSVTLRGPPI